MNGSLKVQHLTFFLPLLLLTGCGNDQPYSGPTGPPHKAKAVAPVTAAPPSRPTDPLVGDAAPDSSDPLLGHDPLQGRAMPTAHSHWLRGRLRDAHVMVLLNGVRYRSFSGVLDQDITMQLRQGANTVTFVYQPNATGAAADLEIVESEHHPAIAPLVTFRSAAVPTGSRPAPGEDVWRPVTKTFPFVAN